MDDVNDTSGGWGEPLDRRALLEKAALAGGALAAGGLLAGRASAGREDFGTVTAFFGQYGTIAEQDALRRTILRDFDGKVDAVFAPLGTNTFVDRTRAEKKAGKGNIDVLIGLHGDFVTFQNEGLVRDVSDVARQIKTLPEPLVKIGKLGTTKQYFVPHSQATYIMVANKDVLKYMPAGADINALTYGQLFQWAKTIRQKTGQNRFGLPASGTGLIHRFFQGFLVPSFSGGMVSTFRTKEAVQGWEYMRQLWKYTHPQSATYAFMQDPLLSEEVLLAWDHVARLNRGLDQRPDDLVAFPVPRGPKSRSYMPVIVGMGIPTQAPPNLAGAKALIKYLTGLSAQAQTLSLLGFFPAVRGRLSKRLSPGLLAEAAAVAKQQAAKDAVQALLPVGIGAENGNFNKIYRDTFNRIVLNGERAQTVLKQQGDLLDEIFVKTNAPCWAPDPPSGKNRCKVK